MPEASTGSGPWKAARDGGCARPAGLREELSQTAAASAELQTQPGTAGAQGSLGR